MLVELENDYTKGNSCYPADLVNAYKYLNDYKVEAPTRTYTSDAAAENVAFAQEDEEEHKGPPYAAWMKGRECYRCHKMGHVSTVCPMDEDEEDEDGDTASRKASEASKKKAAADKAAELKKKAAKKAASKKTATFAQEDVEDDSDSEESLFCQVCVESVEQELEEAVCCVVATPVGILKNKGAARLNLQKMMLLDNQSTIDLFCNKDFVTGIHKVNKHVTVHSNGGVLKTNLRAYMKGKDNIEVWFCEDAITNILSLGKMTERFRVSYDSHKGGAFVVHKPDRQVFFKKHPDGLHYHDPATRYNMAFLNTV